MTSQTSTQLAEVSSRAGRSVSAIIDVLCQRGAFKGEELMAIAQLREQAVQMVALSEAVLSEEASDKEPVEA